MHKFLHSGNVLIIRYSTCFTNEKTLLFCCKQIL